MSQAQNPGDPYRSLEGDRELDLEVIGDIHATDIENYKEHLTEKYSSGDLDGILVTGDLTTNPALGQPDRDGIEDLADYKQLLDKNVGVLDEIGDELDVDLYSVYGNHDPVKGAHTGKEDLIGGFEDQLGEHDEDFSDFDGNYYEFLVDKTNNVEDVSHNTVEIGDYTILGGGSHFEPEVDPQALEEAYETREVEVERGPKASDLVKAPLTGLATLGAAPFGKNVSGTKKVTEEYLPEEKKEEFSDYFEKYEELENLIEDAGDNIIALDHGVPYGSGLDTVQGGANKGSVVWRDLLEEYGDKIDGFVGGHFHGGGEAEMAETPIYNVGEGQYRELGVTNGEIDHFSYDWEDIGGEAPPEPETPQQPQGRGMEALGRQAQQVPDEQIPEDLVEDIMEEENLDREDALQKAKMIGLARSMQRTQQPQQAPDVGNGARQAQAGV